MKALATISSALLAGLGLWLCVAVLGPDAPEAPADPSHEVARGIEAQPTQAPKALDPAAQQVLDRLEEDLSAAPPQWESEEAFLAAVQLTPGPAQAQR